MQLRITNLTAVQVPVLAIRGGKWFSDMLMPGIETTFSGSDLTSLMIGKTVPGAAPGDPDSGMARERFLEGIHAMEGRSDLPADMKVVQIRLLVENYEGSLDISDGTASIGTVAKGASADVTTTQFTLTLGA